MSHEHRTRTTIRRRVALFVGVDSLVLLYRGPTGNLTAEVVFLDNEDKVTRYFAHYG